MTQHTPYDSKIAEYEATYKNAKGTRRADNLAALAATRHMQTGYLQAVADYAALLEAAKVAATYHPVAGYERWLAVVNLLNEAIAQAEGRTA